MSLFFLSIKNVKCTLVQALRLCTGRTVRSGSRGIALPFHDHGTRRGWVGSVMPRPLFTPRKTRYPLCRRLGGPQGRSWQVRKISPPPEFDPRTVQPIASRLLVYKQLVFRTVLLSVGYVQWLNCAECLIHSLSHRYPSKCILTYYLKKLSSLRFPYCLLVKLYGSAEILLTSCSSMRPVYRTGVSLLSRERFLCI